MLNYTVRWKKIVSNIKKFFNKTSKKRDLNGESSPEEDKKTPEEGVPQLAMMMPLRMKYYNTWYFKSFRISQNSIGENIGDIWS